MSGKDATLESIRVAVRKLEKAVAPFEQLGVRLAGVERKVAALDGRVTALFSNGLVARARKAGLLDAGDPEPVLEPEPPALPPTGDEIAATIKAAVGEIGVQLGESLRDALAGLIPLAPARPVKNAAGHPMVSDDLGLDGKSVVAFEQTKG